MARKNRSITLQAAIEGHLRHVAAAHSPATYDDYRRTHYRFLSFVGDMPLTAVTAAHIEDFIIEMRETPFQPVAGGQPKRRRPKTIANMHIALSALWTWAIERGYATEHVAQAVAKPKVHLEPIDPLSPSDVVALVRACNETRPYHNNPLATNARVSAERDKAIIGVLTETAVRVSELCNLRYGDLTFSKTGGNLRVDLGKGNKSRHVPFSRRCAQLIGDYLLTRPEISENDWLFVNIGRNEGLQMTRNAVRLLITRLGKRVGVKVSPHRLRTTAACLMVKNGCTAWQLQRIMGHADIATTMRYVRAAEIDLEEAMRRASPLDNLRL